ncbi:hypothetical protein [Castellaniella sp.]|uniref:hypothetical protein n=1 Tax=Castellaniella sp. TaxID=1955812 RepID=UPI002AFE4EA8|nr:hypothetical protein [Castellaniella sp.]
MTQNIETIVAAHRIAANLRAQGKDPWTYRVRIKDLFVENPKNEDMSEIAQGAAKRLRAALPASMFDVTHQDYDPEIDCIVEAFECICMGDDLDDGELVEEFNTILDDLYNWADINRLWVK